MAFYFNYSGHKCNCWLKVVHHWDKHDSSVISTEKEIKSGLKLVQMETDVATLLQAPFKKKPERWNINTVLL